MKAIVIGAGIGGLTAALCLVARGWDVRVLERAEALNEVGAGLQIPPNAMQVFDALGLGAQLRDVAVEATALEALDAAGRSLFSIALEDRPWDQPYLHIHRADYVNVLAEALEQRAPGSLKLGVHVHDVEIQPDRVELEGHSADLVVAADGIRSAMRRRLFSDASPRWTGNIAWRATVPLDSLSERHPSKARVWMGAGRHAVTYRICGGENVNFVGVVEQEGWCEEGWAIRGDRTEALRAFSAFAPQVTDILQQADDLHKWALFDRPPLETWVKGRVALLGDAAHPMLPFMAQGAAMAVEDAWVLADAVAESGVEDGLKAYHARRHARATRVQAVSQRNARLFHLLGLEKAVAHAVLRLGGRVAPGLVRRRFDWLYGFDPTG